MRNFQLIPCPQLALAAIHPGTGFPIGEDNRRILRETGLKTKAPCFQPEQMGLHTIVPKQATMGMIAEIYLSSHAPALRHLAIDAVAQMPGFDAEMTPS